MIRTVICIAFMTPFIVIAQETTDVSDDLRRMVGEMESQGITELHGHRLLTETVLISFYKHREFQPVWTDPDTINEAVTLFTDAESHGLLPEDFLAYTLSGPLSDQAGMSDAERDILMSEAMLRYVYQREYGKVNPEKLDRDINFGRELRLGDGSGQTLDEWISSGSLGERIDTEINEGPWYALLQAELIRLNELERQGGGWPAIDEGATLHPGDRDVRVRQIRERLKAYGRVEIQSGADPDLFDTSLETAVRGFQQDHHLGVDGVVGPATLRTMNRTVYERIDQVRASLERLRWVNQERADSQDFVAANIAGFRMYLVRDGEMAWTSRVMVGKPYRQTPVFAGRMQYVEFNPTWTVPPGIHRNDILPKVKKDVSYLEKSHMIVLTPQGEEVDPYSVDWNSFGRAAPYIFRQVPGPWNALGQVKFIFPNPHFVFFHDTSHRELFVHPSRAFSSGCVRVQNPLELAARVLVDNEGWDSDRVDQVIESGRTTRVNLDEPLPVFLLYLTAVPNSDGSVLYLDDIYERDEGLLAALNQPMQFELPNAQ